MGVSILDGPDGAVLYCNTTGWAFGPVFDHAGDARAFTAWLDNDPRSYVATELEGLYGEWLEAVA